LNNVVYNIFGKAGLLACLFLLPGWVAGQDFTLSEHERRAYALALNLQAAEAHALIPNPKTVSEHYVMALAEALELLVTEDPEKFGEYEDRFEKRLARKTKVSSVEELFLQAEIGLQWAFVHLKFGHEFDGALNLRQAYQATQEIKKRYPKFTAIQKTEGLLNVIIGSVPEKYNWVLGLLNMEGSVSQGMATLESFRHSSHVLAFEADVLYALTQGFILQQTGAAMQEARILLEKNPGNRLVLFLGASLAMKNAESEDALAMLLKINEPKLGLPLSYAEYLKGEVYLQKAEYLHAISAYRWFINNYKGQNYIKDAWYKIGLCYWLNGNTSDAEATFTLARSAGKEVAEADRYAARSLAETELPHVKLTRVRYFTDGGYYTRAQETLATISPDELVTQRDQVEYAYRQARITHKTNNLAAAREFYQYTIDLAGEAPWYFAPNASLQLGYIAWAANDLVKAKEHFTRALTYKRHEYKNSIDSKARSALAQLNTRK
jgi:tetratricopeptide (TPR) repeat protein